MNERLDSLLERGVESGAVPGAVAIVVDRDGVRYEGAAGEHTAGSGTAMTTDTIGAIYSMTKAVTGAAAMQLVEQGDLDLDAPAAGVCPELADTQVLDGFEDDGKPRLRAPATPITLRHLLTHTSGFVYDMWNTDMARWYRETKTPSITTRRKAALLAPLAFDPGTEWEYGIGIDWAGLMVEAVSGMSLGHYLEQRLTGPLGMVDTSFTSSPSIEVRHAGLHTRDPDGGFKVVPDRPVVDPELEMGGGGLHATMGDYGRFIRMILNDGELDGTRVLAADTVAAMASNQIGRLRVRKLPTCNTNVSLDAEFFPGEPKSWGLTFQINETAVETGRPAGTLMWAGLSNCYFWIDRTNGIGGALMSQLFPFADPGPLGLFLDIERAVYDNR